jgi:elongation factor G
MLKHGHRPSPLTLRIKAKSDLDFQLLKTRASELAEVDSNLTYTIDSPEYTVLLGGQSELHLEKTITLLKIASVPFEISAPEVAYRETINRSIKTEYTYKSLGDGFAQFARVVIHFIPTQHNTEFEFEIGIASNGHQSQYIKGIEKGLRSIVDRGPLIGAPVFGVKAVLLDLEAHEKYSSAIAFGIAARAAFGDAASQASWSLLEPIMKIYVIFPTAAQTEVIEDFKVRRGTVIASEDVGSKTHIKATAPLANVLGYLTTLKNMTQGDGSYTMSFSHYEVVPVTSNDPGNFPPAIAMRA